MSPVTCDRCWRSIVDPITLTDVDGATITICRAHTLSTDELLAEIERRLNLKAVGVS